MGAIGNVGRLEDLLNMRFGLDAHVLLSESLGLLLEVGVLLRQLAQALIDATRILIEAGT